LRRTNFELRKAKIIKLLGNALYLTKDVHNEEEFIITIMGKLRMLESFELNIGDTVFISVLPNVTNRGRLYYYRADVNYPKEIDKEEVKEWVKKIYGIS